jgi:Uma2 family endonuclease
MASTLAPAGTWTHARMLAELPPESRVELIDDELYELPMPIYLHQIASGNLYLAFVTFLRSHKLGYIFTAPMPVVLSEKRVVEPDLFVILQDRLHVEEKYLFGAPDLVIEIISPTSVVRDRVTKKDLYEAHGVREYWLVDPANRDIEVFVLDNDRYRLDNYALGTGPVRSVLLPGLEVQAETIFEP